MQPCHTDSRSFFEKLQTLEGLDLRDNRGKRHDVAVVLTGVMLALLCNRDGCLSSIHRHLVKHYEKLAAVLGVERKRAVSRSQLPLILAQVSLTAFAGVLREDFGLNLQEGERQWFAVDGKELRGSIEAGAKRGEAVAQIVAHESQVSVAQDYYNGAKESEVPVVRDLLAVSGVVGQKVSLDALHCKPETLLPIVAAGGKYLVGVKGNQKELLRQMGQVVARQACLFQSAEVEKGHGRLESRTYEFYDVLEVAQAPRWGACQLRTLISVKRERIMLKSGQGSLEESYYVTNDVGNYEELCQAVRGHWAVETNNHIRDVSLREDRLRSKKRKYSARWGVCGVWPCGSCSKPDVRTRKRSWKTLAMTLTA
jgi:predicted transposase YbfD/YdcC